jgi:hypothetical protein
MIPAIVAALGRGGASKAAASTAAKSTPPPLPANHSKSIGAQKQLADAYEQSNKKTKSMGDSLKSLNQDFVQASAGAYIAKSAVEGVFGTIAGQATIAASALKSMADPLLALTGLSNPAAVKQFTLAFNDAMAVMGRVALPVVNSLTKAMRIVGDAYARAEPFLLRVTTTMAASIRTVFGELEKVWKNNGPMIDMLTTAFTRAIAVGTQVALVFVRIVSTFTKIISAVGKFFGFRDNMKPDASAYGSAVRSVSIGSSGEDVAKKAQETAFMTALQPAGVKPATEVDILGGISTNLMELKDMMLNKIEELPKKIREELEILANKVIEAIPGGDTAKNVVRGAGNAVRDAAGDGLFGLPGMIASALTR